jgi:hypothetical protein
MTNLKIDSLQSAIQLAPSLQNAAARHGNPIRRDQLEAIAAAGQMVCEKAQLLDFQSYVREALEYDLLEQDGALEVLQGLALPRLAAVEGDQESRVRELAIAIFSLLTDLQGKADLPNSDLAEIAAGLYALFSLADEMDGDEDATLAADSLELLKEGAKLGREMAEAI